MVFFEELPGKVASPFRETAQGALALQLRLLTRLGVSLYGMVGEKRTKISLGKEPKVVSGKLLTVMTPIENKGNFRARLKFQATLYDEGGNDDGKRYGTTPPPLRSGTVRTPEPERKASLRRTPQSSRPAMSATDRRGSPSCFRVCSDGP